MSETLIEILAEECPLSWQVVTNDPGVLGFRTTELATPHGLEIRVEFGAHVSNGHINFDAFAGPVAVAVRRAFAAFVKDGPENRSTSGWERRVRAIPRDASDAVGAFASVDEAGTVVGRVPVHALDVLSAAGRVIAEAIIDNHDAHAHDVDENLEEGLPEGARSIVQVNRYERDPRNRARAIHAHGTDCLACGLNFGRVYGPLTEGFIHVHHVVPLSQLNADYVIDPVTDLVPLCANCHSAAHRRNPPLSVKELKGLLHSDSI
jgi:hypothetical protein